MNPMLAGFEKYLPPGILGHGSDEDVQAALLSQRRAIGDAALMSPRGSFGLQGMDAATGGGMAFLQSELEKRDPKVREPLASVTWMRDITVKSGGGWVNFTSNMYADYAIAGPNGLGIQANNTTTIPVVQTNILKDVYRTFAWGNILRVPFIDMQMLQGAGRSLDDLLDKGIKLNWNKTLDQFTYTGPFANTSYPGLLNNPNVTASAVAPGVSGFTQWSKKTPVEILNDINQAMVLTTAASQYDVTGMASSILIPWAQYAYIAFTPVTSAGNVSILTYLLENNIGKTQGIDLKIFPLRWCLGAGAGGTDRMLAYVNNDDRVVIDVTVPIQRIMTVPNISSGGGAYDTLYQGQIGVVKILYLQTILYQDGI